MKPNETEALTFIIAMLLVFAFFWPMGTTITHGDQIKAEKLCAAHGGVDFYDTMAENTVDCMDGEHYSINPIFERTK